jgi:hypothetical protein
LALVLGLELLLLRVLLSGSRVALRHEEALPFAPARVARAASGLVVLGFSGLMLFAWFAFRPN